MHLDIVNIYRGAYEASDKTLLSINANAVVITIVIDIIFFNPSRIQILLPQLFGLSFHPSGTRFAFISLFFSRLLRCFGTGKSAASMICPPRAFNP